MMMVQRIELYRKIGRGGASMESLPVVISASPSFEMEANEAPSVINSFTLVSLVVSGRQACSSQFLYLSNATKKY